MFDPNIILDDTAAENTTSTAPRGTMTIGTVRALNRKVACTPFETTSLEKKTANGFTVAKQKGTLTALTVVFGNDNYQPGMKVYVRADLSMHPQIAGEVYELDGKKFVMIPEENILLRDSRRTIDSTVGK